MEREMDVWNIYISERKSFGKVKLHILKGIYPCMKRGRKISLSFPQRRGIVQTAFDNNQKSKHERESAFTTWPPLRNEEPNIQSSSGILLAKLTARLMPSRPVLCFFARFMFFLCGTETRQVEVGIYSQWYLNNDVRCKKPFLVFHSLESEEEVRKEHQSNEHTY